MSEVILQQLIALHAPDTSILFVANEDIQYYLKKLDELNIAYTSMVQMTRVISVVYVTDNTTDIVEVINKYNPSIITSCKIPIPSEFKISTYNNVRCAISPDYAIRGFSQSHFLLQSAKPLIPVNSWQEIYEVANLYCQNCKYQLALQWIGLIKEINQDNRNQINNILSRACYYLQDMSTGHRACQDLCLTEKMEPAQRNLALRNLQFYIQPLAQSRIISLGLQLPLLPKFTASSTALYQKDNGYIACVRTVNYRLARRNIFTTLDVQQIIRTQNYLVYYNDKLEVQKFTALNIAITLDLPLIAKNIRGLEDVRLFGDHQFFAVCCQFNDAVIPQMCYGRYDAAGLVTELIPLKINSQLQPEKNWLPFMSDGQTYFIYQITPLKIYHLMNDRFAIHYEGDLFPKINIRGSSAPIEYNSGWLLVGHEVVDQAQGRLYYHRLLWMSRDYKKGRWSDLFYFRTIGVEYNLSITPYLNGFILTFSTYDNDPQLCYLPESILQELLIHNSKI